MDPEKAAALARIKTIETEFDEQRRKAVDECWQRRRERGDDALRDLGVSQRELDGLFGRC
jgi:hypothetical protein